MSSRKTVVIVGGGFGGLNVAAGLRNCDVDVKLFDRRNFHLFQPLLYQVATGGLSPANIAAPLRGLLRKSKNTTVVLADVESVDLEGREVVTADGHYSFDYLVIAAGAKTSYFGNDDWAELAPGLKSVEDATEIRAKVLRAFEMAENEQDAEVRARLMTFVIVGGGPTGVELAGAISELANQTLRKDFRHIDPADATIILVDAADRVLSAFSEKSSQRAAAALQRLNVHVKTRAKVMDISEEGVTLEHEDEQRCIATANVIWAAGVQGESLGAKVAAAAGIKLQRGGRIPVGADLRIAGFSNIFAIGDIAYCEGPGNRPLPGVAPVAIQQGKYVAQWIAATEKGQTRPAFAYKDPGSMATIGRRAAVAELWGYKLSGYLAWVIWAVVHILQISLLENRLLVFLQWVWNYVTFNRSARLITFQSEPEESPVHSSRSEDVVHS